jgi:uncharacterized damage-inducible protein DinB
MWRDYFRHFAGYNAWGNARLYDAAVSLSEAEYYADRKAFLRSMHGTLNHLLAIDLLWLGRIRPPAFPLTGYDMIVEKDLPSLRQRRGETDARLKAMIDTLNDHEISGSHEKLCNIACSEGAGGGINAAPRVIR